VRRHNADLDDELRSLIARITPDQLRLDPADGEWNLAHNLAHISEFPHFFANELRRWLANREAPVGRTLEHEARLTAIESADYRNLDDLRLGCQSAFTDLAEAIDQLQDADLGATTHNRKWGPEPLTAFLQRYVLGHKAEHIEQLRRTLDQLR
jgi:uncharacterized damage-inducible protein DinB